MSTKTIVTKGSPQKRRTAPILRALRLDPDCYLRQKGWWHERAGRQSDPVQLTDEQK
jgi:hypothetical protein